MTGFALHPQLAADCVQLVDLPLCAALLMNDSNYPWLILVPRRVNVTDWDQLTESESTQLNTEIRRACAALRASQPNITKLNVASLGNMVPQLHIHVVGRHQGDCAWPRPVWGAVPATRYSESDLGDMTQRIRASLQAQD